MTQKLEESLVIQEIRPSVFFIGKEGNLKEGVDILIEHKKDSTRANIEIKFGLKRGNVDIEEMRKGRKAHRIYLPEIQERMDGEFVLFANGKVQDKKGE